VAKHSFYCYNNLTSLTYVFSASKQGDQMIVKKIALFKKSSQNSCPAKNDEMSNLKVQKHLHQTAFRTLNTFNSLLIMAERVAQSVN
jgi:hypothetical protein